jgi:hypothetical protein
MNKLGIMMLGIMLLGSCDVYKAAKAANEERAKAAAKLVRVPIPAAVQKMINVPFAADGNIHSQARGVFVVKPDTMFCRLPKTFPLNSDDLEQLFRKLGQDQSIGSYFRGNGKVDRDPQCTRSSIFLSGTSSKNRDGTPYKIVLAVWQGDVAKGGAVWVGVVERLSGFRTDVAVEAGDESCDGRPHLCYSQRLDVEDISKKFIEHLIMTENKLSYKSAGQL